MEGVQGFVAELCEHMAGVDDPRVVGRCEHRLRDIICVANLGVFCGADDWTEIEEFGKRRIDWLRTFLLLPHGIPSHDTLQRYFGLLDRRQFAGCLFGWTQALASASAGRVVAIDGKSLRRNGRSSQGV